MNTEEINAWAKKFVETHKNPLKKLEPSGNKFFLPTGTEEETESVQNSLQALTNALQTERVERRCARSSANWLPDRRLAEVTKIVGDLKGGFANKQGRFLYPEETLFLLETNRLELFWNDVPVSIQQAYKIILNNSEDSLGKYITYRKLALQGFRLIRSREYARKQNIEQPPAKKCRLRESEETPKNSIVSSEPSPSLPSTSAENPQVTPVSESDDMFKDIFSKLQENGPKKYKPQVKTKDESDYKLFAPPNNNKGSPDYNLCIFQGDSIEPKMSFLDNEIPTVIGLGYTNSEFGGYFRIGNADIPDLI